MSDVTLFSENLFRKREKEKKGCDRNSTQRHCRCDSSERFRGAREDFAVCQGIGLHMMVRYTRLMNQFKGQSFELSNRTEDGE